MRNYTSGGISMYGTSCTVSYFVTGVRNGTRSSLQTQNLSHVPTVSSSQTMQIPGASRINPVENNGTSRTVSDSVTSVRNTGLILSEALPNNARSSLQTQNLWHIPTASSSQTTHFPGASRINLVENSTYLTFGEQHTNFHGGSSSASWYQSNVVIQPPSGPVRYLRADNIYPPPLPLVIGESTVVVDNRRGYCQRLVFYHNTNVAYVDKGGSFREPGHRDDPIVIEQNESITTKSSKLDDEEDEAQSYRMMKKMKMVMLNRVSFSMTRICHMRRCWHSKGI